MAKNVRPVTGTFREATTRHLLAPYKQHEAGLFCLHPHFSFTPTMSTLKLMRRFSSKHSGLPDFSEPEGGSRSSSNLLEKDVDEIAELAKRRPFTLADIVCLPTFRLLHALTVTLACVLGCSQEYEGRRAR